MKTVPTLDDAIRSTVRSAVEEALADLAPADAPALLDRERMARKLCISVPTLDGLRKQGMPTIWITPEAPRFDVAAVVAWLLARDAKSANLSGATGSVGSES